ncbi:MAG TPA: TetR/AcrR family transcriptional regulator [Solirubrobacterales bacterium]|nr:TetR/AcrR family transcriptional regulator [Solirubrobacterales bacterium]
MVRTPWGDSEKLRDRKMSAGRGTPREQSDKNQRERLFAAIVATVAEKGYEATRVEDLVELSGVSRSSFYRHFEDKEECFLAAISALVQPSLDVIEAGMAGEEEIDLGQAQKAFEALLGRIVAQPAAAKMCFVEVYAASGGIAVVDSTMDAFEGLVARLLEQGGHAGVPPEIVRALIGGVQKVIHKRLYRGEEAELPELAPQLWEWIFLYPPPPGPLRAGRRRHRQALPFEERQAASNPPERILRALAAVVAEKGYPETTVADVVKRAKTSQRTFYEHFSDKEDAMVAAIDSGSSQMLAAALPAFRRSSDWQHAVQATQQAMFSWGVGEPEYARLGAVEMYAAGKQALEKREQVTEGMEGLLAPGYELAPEAPAITAEAIGGALYALFYDWVKQKGAERLAEMVPHAVYITLTPFIGAEEAFEVATG